MVLKRKELIYSVQRSKTAPGERYEMTETKEQTTKPEYYQIKNVGEEWILVKRETRRHNWRFVAKETNPSKLFSQLPGTAGIGKKTIFNITIEGLQ